MDFSAVHVDVVIASYLLSGLCLAGLTLTLAVRDRRLAKKLKDINAD